MIVIATHNGKSHLSKLLGDLQQFGIFNKDICVVDNQSTDKSHLNYLDELNVNTYKVLYNPESTYELGAYKYALDNLKSEYWFCMQDSVRIKTNIFEVVTPLLTDKNVYSFLTYECGAWDNSADIEFLMRNFGTTQYSRACFPSSYFAKNYVMQKVKKYWILPTNKIECMAMERGASIIFDRAGIEIKGLGEYEPTKSGDPDGYIFFSKSYGSRQ